MPIPFGRGNILSRAAPSRPGISSFHFVVKRKATSRKSKKRFFIRGNRTHLVSF
jgi:hypothetical protein